MIRNKNLEDRLKTYGIADPQRFIKTIGTEQFTETDQSCSTVGRILMAASAILGFMIGFFI